MCTEYGPKAIILFRIGIRDECATETMNRKAARVTPMKILGSNARHA
jgi:hypothetical protein